MSSTEQENAVISTGNVELDDRLADWFKWNKVTFCHVHLFKGCRAIPIGFLECELFAYFPNSVVCNLIQLFIYF